MKNLKKIFGVLIVLSFAYSCCEVCKQRPNPDVSSFVDERDNKVYITVEIGEQTWMAENLAYETDSGRFWVYDNDHTKLAKYGYMYCYNTAKNICPAGWHLPSKSEYETLFQNFGGKSRDAYYGLREGGVSSFNALLCGSCYCTEEETTFESLGYRGGWWTSTEDEEGLVWTFSMVSAKKMILLRGTPMNNSVGLYVRCVKD